MRALTRIKQVLFSPIIVLYILTYWGYAARIDKRLSKSQPDNYMVVRVEDLVSNPEATTKEICRFLSVPWDARMISPPKRDSSYIDPNDMYEVVDRGTGMDRKAVERWRNHIPARMKAAVRMYGSVFYPCP